MDTNQCKAQTNSGDRCSRNCAKNSKFCTQHKQFNQKRQIGEALSKALHPKLGKNSPLGVLDGFSLGKILSYIPNKKEFSIRTMKMNSSEDITCSISQGGKIIYTGYVYPRVVFPIDPSQDLSVYLSYNSFFSTNAGRIYSESSFTIESRLLENGEKLVIFEHSITLYDKNRKAIHTFTPKIIEHNQ